MSYPPEMKQTQKIKTPIPYGSHADCSASLTKLTALQAPIAILSVCVYGRSGFYWWEKRYRCRHRHPFYRCVYARPKQSGLEYANSAPWRRDQVSSASASRWHQCGNWKGSLFRNKTRLKRNKNPAWISTKSVRNGRKITKFSTPSTNRKYAVPISLIFLEMRNLRLLVNIRRYAPKADATGRRSWARIVCWRDLKIKAYFERMASDGTSPKWRQVNVSQHFRARHHLTKNSEYNVLQCIMLYCVILK
jgi:hypothetical protein